MIEDNKGQIWIGKEGIEVFNEASNTLHYATMRPELSGNDTYVLLQDRKGQFWRGSDVGLDIIDSAAQTVKNINKALGIAKVWVRCLFEDNKGRVWAGTQGLGLFMIDQEAGLITNFTLKNGLSDMNVVSLIGKNNRIYIGT